MTMIFPVAGTVPSGTPHSGRPATSVRAGAGVGVAVGAAVGAGVAAGVATRACRDGAAARWVAAEAPPEAAQPVTTRHDARARRGVRRMTTIVASTWKRSPHAAVEPASHRPAVAARGGDMLAPSAAGPSEGRGMGVFGKLHARMRGELSDEPLQAYRRAGAAVDALMADVEQRRVDATLAGRTGWTMERSAQVEALCAWCAFVLQQLGDSTLDAHEARNPGGFVSEQTSEQVMAYYRGVQDWVRRGHEAESSPAYRIDVRLPVDVPGPAGAWRERPPAHLEGMR